MNFQSVSLKLFIQKDFYNIILWGPTGPTLQNFHQFDKLRPAPDPDPEPLH